MTRDLSFLARHGGLAVVAVLALQSLAWARCPIPDSGALFVRAPLGNLRVETSASGFVEVQVSNPAIQVEERCFEDHAEIGGMAPERVYGPIEWLIQVPPTVDLDLTTFAGEIRVASTRGALTARTMGGSVIVGDVGGSAAIITQGGGIVAGNIGGDAELRSVGGQIEIGNVGGDAELEATFGSITTGTVSGRVQAETAGGMINIRESRGDLNAVTFAGDIVIGAAGRTTAQTAGGNIVGLVIRGPFRGSTELGDIRIERAESFVEATSGLGDVEARLVPSSLTGDLHITLRTNAGNIRLWIPEDLPADVEAVIDRAAIQEPAIRSEFPLETVRLRPNVPTSLGQQYAIAPLRSVTELNGGGNPIRLQTFQGTIEIRKNPR